MWGSPYYPAGVTDADIERYFGDNGCRCETCEYYSSGTCRNKENDLTEEEAEEMTQEEYDKYIAVDSDDYCDDFEGREEEIPDYIEDSWKDEMWEDR